MADHEDLRQFLFDTTQVGYGNPDVKVEKSADGANVIVHTKGDWRMRDVFYGGHPYAGQEVIYKNDKPVWAMQYRGRIFDTERTPSEVYNFIKKALLQAPEQHPYRGPEKHTEGDLTYTNNWQGDILNVKGEESILENGLEIYKGLYFGGTVDE